MDPTLPRRQAFQQRLSEAHWRSTRAHQRLAGRTGDSEPRVASIKCRASPGTSARVRDASKLVIRRRDRQPIDVAALQPARPLDRLAIPPGRRAEQPRERRLAVVPEDVVHPGLLGGWLVSKPPVPRRTPDEAAR